MQTLISQRPLKDAARWSEEKCDCKCGASEQRLSQLFYRSCKKVSFSLEEVEKQEELAKTLEEVGLQAEKEEEHRCHLFLFGQVLELNEFVEHVVL